MPGKLLLALAQVVERGLVDVGLDRHVRVRRLGDALDHALVDRARAHADHVAEAAVQAGRLRLRGGHRRHLDRRGAARGAGEPPALAALGAVRLAAVGVELALEAAQLLAGPQPGALDLGAGGAVAVGGLQHGGRQLARDDLHDRRDAGRDELAAVAVHDVAARRLDADLAHAVLARLADVLLARQDLQEPQPEEDDREQHEREAAEDGDAHRELRRDGGAPFFEGRRQGYARESGLRPPVVYARRRRRRGSSGRNGSSTRRISA